MGQALPSPVHRFLVAAAIVFVLFAWSLEECKGDGGAYVGSTTTSSATSSASTSVPPFQFDCQIRVQNANISSSEIAWQRALNATEALLSIWYNPSCNPHCFTNGSFWTDANALETLLNLKAEAALHPGENSSLTQQLENVTADIYSTQNTAPLLVAPPFFDDALWWGLAWLRAYEEYGSSAYLDRSLGILDTVYRLAWDPSTCGGGVWWSATKTYKNAVTNELFTALASKLALTTGNQTIERWAKKAFNWFAQSGMLDPNINLINDGLTSTCQNNNGTTWTYNQGVILSASINLYSITNDICYLNYAEMIACATLTRLVFQDDDVLKEPCDLDAGGCFGDGQQFKGVFARHLFYATRLLEAVSQSPAPWRNDIGNMGDIMWANDRLQSGTLDELAGNWNGPVDAATPIRQAAALDLLIFAANLYSHDARIAMD